jgi:hypothetical protein
MDGRVREERSLGELFGDLTDDVRMLLRQEVALARTEVSDKVAHLSRDGMRIGVGGVLAFVGFQALVATAIIALDLIIPLWLSALLVGAVLAIVGYVLIRQGMNDVKRRGITPTETISSLKEDSEWLQDQVR